MKSTNENLGAILAAREYRAQRQQELLAQYGKPLVSFTMNIAGPVKNSALIRLAFYAGLARMEKALGRPLHREVNVTAAGCEALLVYEYPAPELKERCVALDSETPVGRLYDMDVLDVTGEKLCRSVPRKCLVCGGPVSVCARSRAHGLDLVQSATQTLLRQFAAGRLAATAVEALRREVHLTPKPGLVDEVNSGAHDDMDLPLFEKSAAALEPYFADFVTLGMDNVAADALQRAGLAAEQAMFAATGGVNTHKGAIYLFGLVLWALGRILVDDDGDVWEKAAAKAAALPVPQGTHGSGVRAVCGGVRQEALTGFPCARKMAQILAERDELTALLWGMAHVDDSTLVYRGGKECLQFVRWRAEEILAVSEERRIALMQELDEELIARHLSPGGSADLLALAMFWQRAEVFIGRNTTER